VSDKIPVLVTDASVRECVIYANLELRGENVDQIGTPLTVEILAEFDRWLQDVKRAAWAEGNATGRSRAMRMMSDEPELSILAPNPYEKEADK
jgi:hypothetical protein